MVWQVDWDEDYVVGGADHRQLTPNFRLSEFKTEGGVRVHRELVTALQMLRDRYGDSLAIVGVDPDGLGARLKGRRPMDLLEAARRVRDHHLFDDFTAVDGELHVRIPDLDELPPIGIAQALETAFCVTARFETRGDPFQEVAGNFDGAGLSFGPGQVNFGTGTLVPMFRSFAEADESALRACFTDPADYDEWMAVLDLPKSDQLAWATAKTTGRFKAHIFEPWNGYLAAVGRVPTFRRIMVETLLTEYGRRVMKEVAYLTKIAPGIKIDHLRCFCALYDLVIQQGSLSKAKKAIETRVAQERPKDQFELVAIAVEERSRRANKRWRADCESRRMGILRGLPITIGDSQRANINFYMLRNVRIGDPDTSPADALATVADSLAAGDTLLV